MVRYPNTFVAFALLAIVGIGAVSISENAQAACRWVPTGDVTTTAGAYVCDTPRGTFDATDQARSDTYAAVAISPTSLDTGVSWGAQSVGQARWLAVHYCAKSGNSKDCKVVEWARDACVAIAVDFTKKRWGFSWNMNRTVANAQAVSLCNWNGKGKGWGKGCRLQSAACSSD